MDNLDTPVPSKQLDWNNILRQGAFAGLALTAFSIITYLLNVNLMAISGIALLYSVMFAVSFTFAIMAIKYQRDKLDGGYISYGKALLIALATVFIGVLISSLWNYVLVNFIDPNVISVMKEEFIETWGQSMPADALDQALEGFDKAGDLFTTLKSALTGGLIYGLIVGLISAAFLKRQPEVKG
ncbi:MAG TPA: DUF4199 domain-containing protein [Saprospiraceae bacterium]|nr:DUF4199 domain-containing protein [Saprospiraceae bacterium]